MDLFDLIRELRKGEPDVKKAAKAMKILGWICVVAAVWNFAFEYFFPIEDSPFVFPKNFPYIALATLLCLSALFFYSARGITEGEPRGKQAGQLALLLLFAAIISFIYFVFPVNFFPLNDRFFLIFFSIFGIIFIAQFGAPVYFGIRYLGRLPVKEDVYSASQFKSFTSEHLSGNKGAETPTGSPAYKEALLPFGVFGTFALFLAVPLLSFFLIEKYYGMEKIIFLMPLVFVFIFLGPVLYNLRPSSFQQNRNLIASYTGGGSISLFSGSWPFFRLLIYEDGVEVRVVFHSYFIPYDKMEDLPDKIGFFTRGILFKSNLPDVPSGIRFQGFGMKKTLEVLKKYKIPNKT